MPNQPTPKKTSLAKHSFASGKAAQTAMARHAQNPRKPSDPPRTLEALEALLKKSD